MITGFVSTEDKIELSSALGLATGDARTAIAGKGAIDNSSSLAEGFEALIGDGVDFFNDGAADRALAFGDDGTDGWLFVDANADGNFTFADDMVISLAGVTSIVISDVVFG